MKMKYSQGSSAFQKKMEEYLLGKVREMLGVELVSNAAITINTGRAVFIQPDFYSEEHKIIGEIHVHAGKLKGGQPKKIAGDILKMLLHDRAKNCTFTKYIVVCDPEEYTYLEAANTLAESIRLFGVHLVYIPLPEKQRSELLNVMSRQNLLNWTKTDARE